jgi:hypothetical protein
MLTHIPTTEKQIKIKIVSLNIVFVRSSFLNMSQSPPKDFSYMGLLLHSPS